MNLVEVDGKATESIQSLFDASQEVLRPSEDGLPFCGDDDVGEIDARGVKGRGQRLF